MLRQTISIIEQQKNIARAIIAPRHILSNQAIPNPAQPIQQPTSRFDWNPVKYNFNFSQLKSEYANYCKQNNLINKLEAQTKLSNAENTTVNQDIQTHLLQTVVFSPLNNYNYFPTSEAESIVYDMQNKRSKQAKKKRSKRKNGGHQSIRC